MTEDNTEVKSKKRPDTTLLSRDKHMTDNDGKKKRPDTKFLVLGVLFLAACVGLGYLIINGFHVGQ